MSSLILLPQFDFKTLKEAFILEENNRKAAEASAGIVAAANLSRTSNKRPNASKQPSNATDSSNRPVCEFCQTHFHTQSQCRLYKEFKLKAAAQALENLQNRRKAASYTSNSSHFVSNVKPITPNTSELASNVQDGGNVEEFAGNASITFPASPLPQCSLSVRWCADTGASSHMTPHRAWFEEYEPYSVPVRVADGTVVNSAGIGSV